MLRGFWHISQQDECEAMTGLVTVSIASQKVFTETWEISTITPTRSISRTTSRP